MKFSDIYIETTIKKSYRFINESNYETNEYEERKFKKELIPKNKELYYLWGNIGNSILMDYNCNININIKKIKDLCFYIERKIKKGDIDIVKYDIMNLLLPLLDRLTDEEINIIKKANRESAGPLYDYQPHLSTPQIFIDLFR